MERHQKYKVCDGINVNDEKSRFDPRFRLYVLFIIRNITSISDNLSPTQHIAVLDYMENWSLYINVGHC